MVESRFTPNSASLRTRPTRCAAEIMTRWAPNSEVVGRANDTRGAQDVGSARMRSIRVLLRVVVQAPGPRQKVVAEADMYLAIRGLLPFVELGWDEHRHAADRHFIAAVRAHGLTRNARSRRPSAFRVGCITGSERLDLARVAHTIDERSLWVIRYRPIQRQCPSVSAPSPITTELLCRRERRYGPFPDIAFSRRQRSLAVVLMALSSRPDPMYGSARFKPSLVRELPKNGDVPKSPLLPIGSPGAVGRHNSTHDDSCVVSRGRSFRARQLGVESERDRHENSAPSISASSGGCCRASSAFSCRMGAGLSVAIGAHRRRLSRRGPSRHPRSRDGSMVVRPSRPAIHH